ncbi:hypothetical protein M011DRAFT_459562 [Sporormia fimetaria CBS 119925]|uniref:Uncharacterized protein n=1 Tax=Sporormia fimetaria CBS 119925 TaxID=1340428 RepID=A0A6A6V9R7_9PLEO|nr:hypothetical protein M011DRAFT_459562 [Sporormia fimetaria CBS 119925]
MPSTLPRERKPRTKTCATTPTTAIHPQLRNLLPLPTPHPDDHDIDSCVGFNESPSLAHALRACEEPVTTTTYNTPANTNLSQPSLPTHFPTSDIRTPASSLPPISHIAHAHAYPTPLPSFHSSSPHTESTFLPPADPVTAWVEMQWDATRGVMQSIEEGVCAQQQDVENEVEECESVYGSIGKTVEGEPEKWIYDISWGQECVGKGWNGRVEWPESRVRSSIKREEEWRLGTERERGRVDVR